MSQSTFSQKCPNISGGLVDNNYLTFRKELIISRINEETVGPASLLFLDEVVLFESLSVLSVCNNIDDIVTIKKAAHWAAFNRL